MTDALVRLAEARTISLLAVRFLHAALSTGRNIIVTGPQQACLPLLTALVAQSEAPGVYSDALHQEGEDEGSKAEAAERLAAWQMDPVRVARALLHHVGVVAHLPAGRLDRLLMRLELALMSLTSGPSAPLAVMAAVDLVVVIGANKEATPSVQAIYEIAMDNQSYRPVLLFKTGTKPVLEALVPVSQPSFLHDLLALGEQNLVKELSVAAPIVARRHEDALSAVHEDDPHPAGAAAKPSAAAQHPREAPLGATRRPAMQRTIASAPGWELDQDAAEEPTERSVAPQLDLPTQSDDVSAMVATDPEGAEDTMAEDFVLEPPPPPKA